MLEQVSRMTKRNSSRQIDEIEEVVFRVKHTLKAANGGYSVRVEYSNLPAVAQPNPVNLPLLYMRNEGKNDAQSTSNRLSYQ